jgi:hypothetical protein
MAKFVVGDRVARVDCDQFGNHFSGVIIEAFYWKDSTDGTKNPPSATNIPVEWDDGTFGYCPVNLLAYEEFTP